MCGRLACGTVFTGVYDAVPVEGHTLRASGPDAGVKPAATGVKQPQLCPRTRTCGDRNVFNDGFQRWSHVAKGCIYKRTLHLQTLTPSGGIPGPWWESVEQLRAVTEGGCPTAPVREPPEQPGGWVGGQAGQTPLLLRGVSSHTVTTWRRHLPSEKPWRSEAIGGAPLTHGLPSR